MKEVVYISWMPLTERVERDWYLSHLIAQGVHVEYWDVTDLLFGGESAHLSLQRGYVTRVTAYDQLCKLLKTKDSSNTNYVMIVNFEARFHRLYRLLTSHGCRLSFFEWGNFPIKDRSRKDRYAPLFRNPGKTVKRLTEKVIARTCAKLGLIRPFDTVFAAGYASFEKHPDAARHIAVNLCDYDNFLQTKGSPQELVDGRYCVFLDINLPFQSDIKVVGWDYIDGSAYAASLNRFFSMVEERYGVKTVIAAHPKAQYDNHYFEGRTTLKGVTPELVKDAQFVLSHHSTSISYAVLNTKPLLFIYTDDMAKVYPDTIVGWMGDFAEYLNAPLYNVDAVKSREEIAILEPDTERYDLYKYNYLTTRESEHMLTRDIFYAEITK